MLKRGNRKQNLRLAVASLFGLLMVLLLVLGGQSQPAYGDCATDDGAVVTMEAPSKCSSGVKCGNGCCNNTTDRCCKGSCIGQRDKCQ
jgi:hypothetical protein